MRTKIIISLIIIFATNITIYGQDSIPRTTIAPGINTTDIKMPENITGDNYILQNQVQSQKLLKNLFLAGFIFMTIAVIFLLYVNSIKIKQVLKMVKNQERQVELKTFEIEKLSIILNNTIDAILIINEKGEILWNNESFLTLYSLTKEEAKNKTIDIFSSNDTNIDKMLKKVKENKKPVQFTFDFNNKENITIYIQRRIIPFADNNGNVANYAIIDSDYTALKMVLKNEEKKITEN